MQHPDASITSLERTLTLQLGCVFELRSRSATNGVMQVAPHDSQDATLDSEWWDGVDERHPFVDIYGNRCQRLTVPEGTSRISYGARVSTSYEPDVVDLEADEHPPSDLPDDLLHWTMPSRFCQSDELGGDAETLFRSVPSGWARVQAICDFVNDHLDYVEGSSNPWTTSTDVYRARQGVCRDYAHLAIAFCRAFNLPTRYVFGYVPEVGAPIPDSQMDFAAWFEVWMSDRWYTFDARLNEPRIGRVVVGRGRDAVDVAMLTTFGAVELTGFSVQADELGQPS